MKRTEKVEIRVSLEEKQTLTQLAKQNGESVSSLIRGLVEKYIALNTASTTRRLPKWQIAAGLIVAAFVGHALTLIPMHLHERGHQAAAASAPIYMVHGAIGRSAFGVGISEAQPTQHINIQDDNGADMIVKLAFEPTMDCPIRIGEQYENRQTHPYFRARNGLTYSQRARVYLAPSRKGLACIY